MKKPKPPDPTSVAALLRERWSVPPSADLTVQEREREGRPRLVVRLERARRRGVDRIELDVTHLRGGAPDQVWDRLVDAVDALVGSLVESGYAYRELPTGSDVEYEGSVLWVEVTRARPDLEAQADALLTEPS